MDDPGIYIYIYQRKNIGETSHLGETSQKTRWDLVYGFQAQKNKTIRPHCFGRADTHVGTSATVSVDVRGIKREGEESKKRVVDNRSSFGTGGTGVEGKGLVTVPHPGSGWRLRSKERLHNPTETN